MSLASAPKAERKYRRTIRENIKRIKAALDDVERTIDYSTDWEFPPEAVQPLEFSPEIKQKLEFPPEVTQGLTMPPMQPLTFPRDNLSGCGLPENAPRAFAGAAFPSPFERYI